MGNIYSSICAVMGEIGAIKKEKKNQQQGFMYRGIDDVMNVLNPLMVKHKIFVIPEMLEHEREERQTAKGTNLIYSICKMRYTFCSDDGSSISAVVIGEGMDSGDKATNKAMAIAMKYAMFQVFCIPTEEMTDPDGETPEASVKKETKASTKKDKKKFVCECCGKEISETVYNGTLEKCGHAVCSIECRDKMSKKDKGEQGNE